MFIKLIMPVALVAGLSVSIGCRGGFPGHGDGGHMPGGMLESHLKISTVQKTALHEVFKRHKPALAAKVGTLVEARNAATDTGMDPAVTPEAWRAQQDKVADAVYGVAKEFRSAYLDVLPILSDSQKAEGKDLLKKAQSRMESMHRHMGGLHGRHHEFVFQFVKNRLDLTEAQAKAIQTILDNHKAALTAKHETLHKALETALEAGLDPATSQAVLDQRFATAKEAGIALSTEVRTAYLEIVPQLTPDQREGAKELMKDFRNTVDSVRKLMLGF